jgi:hypothetical protein
LEKEYYLSHVLNTKHKLNAIAITGAICLEFKDEKDRATKRDADRAFVHGTTFHGFCAFPRFVDFDPLRLQALRRQSWLDKF